MTLAVVCTPRAAKTSLARLILRQTSGRPRFFSWRAASWASMDMMTLLKPSAARAGMFCSVQSEPLVQIMGWMPALGGVAGHRAEVFVNEGFAADEQEVADVVVDANVNDVAAPPAG